MVKTWPMSILICLAAVLALSGAARAEPIIPKKAKIEARLRVLADLRRFSLGEIELPSEGTAHGLTSKAVRVRWTALFRRNGFEIVKPTEGVPELSVFMRTTTEKSLPGAVAFCSALRVTQVVRVERLNESMALLTYSDLALGLEPVDKVYDVMDGALDQMLNHFFHQVRIATEFRRGTIRPDTVESD